MVPVQGPFLGEAVQKSPKRAKVETENTATWRGLEKPRQDSREPVSAARTGWRRLDSPGRAARANEQEARTVWG